MTKFKGDAAELVATAGIWGKTAGQLPDGGTFVSWLSASDDHSIKIQRYDADGQKTGDVLSFDYLENYTLAVTHDGGWLIEGTDRTGDVPFETVRRYDAAGDPVDLVEDAYAGFELIKALPGGDWVGITFVETAEYTGNLVQQRYDENGNAVGPATVLTDGPGVFPSCDDITVLEDGGWVVTWSGSSALEEPVWQQRFTREGVAAGEAISYPSQYWEPSLPATTALPDGGWVTLYKSEGHIRFKRFDENGNTLGTPKAVFDDFNISRESWTIQALSGGGWVAAWVENHSTVRALAFDASGTAMGRSYVVGGAAYADKTGIEAFEDGSFAISWQESLDGTISRRVYHASDNTDPVAVDDKISLQEGRSLDLGQVILNDYDLDPGDTLTLESAIVIKGQAKIHKDYGRLYLEDRSYSLTPGETTKVVVEYKVSDGFDTTTGQLEIKVSGRRSDGDVIEGTRRADHFYGSSFDEIFLGLGGKDFIQSGDGNDILVGDAGNDTLNGGSGKDTLVGGRGDDRLIGGTGSDRFIFAPGDGQDKIIQPSSWSTGTRDIIDLTAFDFRTTEQVQRLIEVKGRTIVIDLPGHDKITIIENSDHHMYFTI